MYFTFESEVSLFTLEGNLLIDPFLKRTLLTSENTFGGSDTAGVSSTRPADARSVIGIICCGIATSYISLTIYAHSRCPVFGSKKHASAFGVLSSAGISISLVDAASSSTASLKIPYLFPESLNVVQPLAPSFHAVS